MMAIHDWPEAERPREKLLQRGATALSDAELLAIFLRCGQRGHSAVDRGREVLQHFGDLRHLLSAGYRDFIAQPGLGTAAYCQLHAALELGQRHLHAIVQRQGVLHDPGSTRAYLTHWLRERPHEVFACLFLDSQHRIIASRELFHGTIDSASVHPREIVRQALQHNAAAVILAHNHPSGVAEPSMADRHITQLVQKALALIDVRVLDHIVVGGGNAVSLAERGWMTAAQGGEG